MSVLSVKRVSKSYVRRPIVEDLSLEVRRGEIVGLLGPSGAGKTTIFDMLIGLTRPDDGRVLLGDMDITALPVFRRARLGISYLTQQPSVFSGLTVEQNIMIVLENHESKFGRRGMLLDRLLHDFDLSKIRKKSVTKISGGERRRCELARAMASNPSIILLDEPFAGVDPIAVEDISVLLSMLSARGVGVLISDHRAREVLNLVERAYVMESGRIIAHGFVEDLYNQSALGRYLNYDFVHSTRERSGSQGALPADLPVASSANLQRTRPSIRG